MWDSRCYLFFMSPQLLNIDHEFNVLKRDKYKQDEPSSVYCTSTSWKNRLCKSFKIGVNFKEQALKKIIHAYNSFFCFCIFSADFKGL